MSLYDNFRRNLRAQRKARRLSQEALASLSGYSVSYIARLERGEHQNPTLGFFETMATALGCAPEELLHGQS